MGQQKIIKIALAIGLAAAVTAAATTAFASGSSGGGTTSKCSQYPQGSSDYNKCLKGGRAAMNNEELYSAGYQLAKSGDYEGALELLTAGNYKSDVRFLTMIGYSTRKLGKVDEGMGYYMQALAIDPNSVTTREYLGEAYLQKKDLASAKGQLSEIANRCGVSCETYTTLNDQIGKFQTGL